MRTPVSFMEEAIRSWEGQTESIINLDCGCKIYVDSKISVYARASAIRAHYAKFHPEMSAGRKF